MQIDVVVTRADIVRINVAKLFRFAPNVRLLVATLLVVLIIVWRNAASNANEVDWAVVGISSVVVGLGAFAFIFALSLIFALVPSSVKSGVIGAHTYTIEEKGLREQTTANDTLTYWPSIISLEKSSHAIFVQINSYLFHVLPRKSFKDKEQFETFYRLLAEHRGNAV